MMYFIMYASASFGTRAKKSPPSIVQRAATSGAVTNPLERAASTTCGWS
jgi:hypothetical protein